MFNKLGKIVKDHKDMITGTVSVGIVSACVWAHGYFCGKETTTNKYKKRQENVALGIDAAIGRGEILFRDSQTNNFLTMDEYTKYLENRNK